MSIAFLFMERQHEDALYYNIIRATKANNASATNDTAYIRRLMNTIHTMMYNRNAVFNNTEQLSLKNKLFHSVDEDLMYGHGACGGFSKVLSRSLQLSGYKVRIGQMKVNGTFGGHIIVEVFLKDVQRWAVIDPLFLLTFPGADGAWAGFDEIRSSWQQYQPLVPADYNKAYNYADVRYANWEKIPVAGKMIYKSLGLLFGEVRAHGISVRPYMLNMYSVWLKMAVSVYLLFCFFSYRRFSKKSTPVEAKV
ncbi:hypothetical protein ESA94_21135 [Lacibacter luteus]|uniref:Transglutaminase domain-containing protein n=1 Tax=Lacibacter luteus TaxID=2508719 RepID=A0A4Q1CDR0_9BACT|nr:hypothetical protein [Lacibacter luteus]RXK57439.1 hypothetical protein ESA94_21135 [Lacibacter luteus]